MPQIRYATPTPDDAERLLFNVAIAFDGYRDIAPPGWEPPDSLEPEMVERVKTHLANPEAFGLMALYGPDPIAHTMWTPARVDNDQANELIPGLIHLGALFVLEPWWGKGIATTLHAKGVETMAARGWQEARLYTPADQHRARGFYEREGWHLHRSRYFEPRTGLDMVEYRRPLG